MFKSGDGAMSASNVKKTMVLLFCEVHPREIERLHFFNGKCIG